MDLDSQAQPVFLVDWHSTWRSVEDVRVVHQAFSEAGRRLSRQGANVRSLYSVFVPVERRWICLFTASHQATARAAADLAQIPQRYIRSTIPIVAPSTPEFRISNEDIDLNADTLRDY
jgi:hypothetical protein